MSLFSSADIAKINQTAKQSTKILEATNKTKKSNKSITSQLDQIYQKVLTHFQDSDAILINSKELLDEYIDKAIEGVYVGIDTETTGLDRQKDYIVGMSLYSMNGDKCYIPNKHLVPIFDEPYSGQLTYQDCHDALERLMEGGVKFIFANADYDLSMIYKDYKIDLLPNFYADVILAWRCLKEDELDNRLKSLYYKYVEKSKGDGMQFSDLFTPELFRYAKPEIAKYYAANDADITLKLFMYELQFLNKQNPLCKKHKLERIADLYWKLEIPMVGICQRLHRDGIYIDNDTCQSLKQRYNSVLHEETHKLQEMVQNILDSSTFTSGLAKRPFVSGKDFNPKSVPHVNYLLYKVMNLPSTNGQQSTGKEILAEFNLPITQQILKVRSINVLISTFVDKLPKEVGKDNRIHAQFKQIGANCVVGNTIIPTNSGYYLAKDLCKPAEDYEGVHVDVDDLQIINKDQQVEQAQSVIKYTNYPTIKLTTEMGFVVEGTYNHPIMVSNYNMSDTNILYNPKAIQKLWKDRQFRKLEDIRIGDIIEIPCNYTNGGTYQKLNLKLGRIYNNRNSQAIMPQILNEDVAEFLGMYHADGSAAEREGTYTITLSNDDDDVIKKFDLLSKKIFNVTTCRYDKQKHINEIDSYINCKRLLEFDSLLSHGTRNKRIPQLIWKSPQSVINAYIRGMTLDSSVYIEQPTGRAQFDLSVINIDDARLVQCHLASQGILAGWGWDQDKDGNSVFPRLRMNSDNYQRFRDKIGFIESKKIITTGNCKKNKYDRRRIQDSFRLAVKSIEYGTNNVYDLHVPGTHSFVSNGMISHNTGRMCIAKGTKITCLNKDKNIEDIRPGDIVFCYDEEHTCIELAKVKNLWLTGKDRDCVKIKWYSYGEQTSGELICTPEHPILKKNGSWVEAHTLTQKDKIFRLKRKNRNIHELDLNIKDISLLTDRKDDILIDHTHEIISVEECGKYEVYDIEVEGYHNFIANELLVHNSSADPNLQNIPSHAIDIRHMFRATPQEIIDIKYENELYIKIHDSLKTIEGWKYGDEITENDIIVDIAEREYKVLGISIHSGNVTLILDNVQENTLFPVKHSAYVMLSSDYSQQEPKLTAFVSKDKAMIQAFKDGKDIYATIASLSFNLPYEKCLEFHPETGEYQPDGKARRGEAKSIVLGEQM